MSAQRSTVLAAVLPAHLAQPSITTGAFAMVAGSLFLALCAQVSIPLPGGVPITGQTFGVLLIGAALGSRLGVGAVLCYLAEGAMGLPVFAGGMGGIHHLAGASAGYLVGFVPAAYLVGRECEKGFDRRMLTSLAVFTGATGVIFLFGMLWLGVFAGLIDRSLGAGGSVVSFVLAAGLLPFLPGAVLKIVAAAISLPAAWRVVQALGLPKR